MLDRELACHLGPEGHRVNSISSGPIRTIAASGIPGFDNILDHVAENAPLRRNVTQSDVAGCTTWLASPLSAGVTGSAFMSMQVIPSRWFHRVLWVSDHMSITTANGKKVDG